VSTRLVGGPSVDDPGTADARSDGARAARRGWAAVAVGVVVAVGIAVRLRSPSALWLDEAISVSISGLPLTDIPAALRRDGAPPLYAVALWAWERLVGDGPTEVRWLSALFGIAALPVAAVAGGRLAGRAGAVAALLLLATSPFAVYYSSEARMYSLVILLVLCGVLALDDYLRRPRPLGGVLVAIVTAALALTHYWTLFLLAVVAGALLARAWRAGSRRDAGAVAWMAGGGLLFLPWLPAFLYQFTHTGTPWGSPAGFGAALSTVAEWSGGTGATSRLLAVVLLLLAGVGATATAMAGWRLELDLRGRPPGRGLAVVGAATLVLALLVGQVTGAAFAARYTSVVLPLFLLLAAVGVARLSARLRTAVLAVAVVAGLSGAVPHAFDEGKTQAAVVAQALRSEALAGDVVVYCPDQLGPATSRLLPGHLRQEVYPTGGSPARVDWVDYEERNRRADPSEYARDVSARAGRGAVWLVTAFGYRTYEGQCEALVQAFTDLRGAPLLLVEADGAYFEPASVRGWAPPGAPGTLP
jgi:mannosyltransferase